jgi:hypothetical protein
MARVFGVTSTVEGLTASLLQNITKNETTDRAEARNEVGKVTDLKAYSKTVTASAEFVIDSTDTMPEVGTELTIGSVTGLITDKSVNENNTAYQAGTLAIETKDAAELDEYA